MPGLAIRVPVLARMLSKKKLLIFVTWALYLKKGLWMESLRSSGTDWLGWGA